MYYTSNSPDCHHYSCRSYLYIEVLKYIIECVEILLKYKIDR
jgi:hypothetical protein